MPIVRTLTALLVSLVILTGCATKNYGRMEPLAAESGPSDCAALDAQLAEATGFRKQVQRESEFSGADVVAFLIDFGIGNAMEKSAALKSADEREAMLKAKQEKLGCGEGVRRAKSDEPADEAPRQTAEAKAAKD